ncbi:S41 family peptidase [Paenibacillus senegalensis]|uniref:S41 family peptidase n=1 Tax=Paenibacillus senegalensis TaxID=1465766 RepID=UPI000287CAFF|nr:S41 family peptidase [Paenibacillus senegalensis]
MVFRGRTVIAFIVLAIFASSVVTMTVMNPGILEGRISSGQAGEVGNELTDKDLEKVATTYDLIRTKYLEEVSHDQIVDGAINGMLASLNDPYSVYMTAAEAKQFDESISSSFEGIGAEVSMQNGRVTIVSPIKESPAEKAGLRAQDVILSVDGEKLDGLTLNEAVAKIRGPKGSEVKLEILREGSSEPMVVTLVRDTIPLETVYSEMLEGNIGKIEITQFSYETNKRFFEELQLLESQGMEGLVIDVRNNPGGLLDRVVDIVQPFIEKGQPIVLTEDRSGKRESLLSRNENGVKNYPIAVLINEGSASASEILAGALKESGNGYLVGATTFGKGTVQVMFEEELGDGSNIKMTTYKWLTPDGNWINETGVEPDLEVKQPEFFMVKPLDKEAVLTFDMAGEDVRSMQIMLQALGYPVDRTDGYFSAQTLDVVKAFQQDNELPVSDEVEEQMMISLEAKIVEEIRDPANDQQLTEAVNYILQQINN